jgi:hypothetical protein
MAAWLASTMYYQHPAVHPLPPSLLSSSSSAATSEGGRKRQRPGKKNVKVVGGLSSYILGEGGQHSMHDRVRLPGAGCMGGLGTSMPPDNNGDRGRKDGAVGILGDRDGRARRQAPTPAATVSSLLLQRRRDWQAAFRSAYQSWRSRLRGIEGRRSRRREENKDVVTRRDEGATALPTQDETSRCSFYSISPRQVILFRGGCVDDVERNSTRSDEDGGRISPVIVFSSTTAYLRSRLRSMGVDMRLFARGKRDKADEGYALFSESLFDADGENITSEGGDAESVHAELDAIKRADDEKGKVIVEVKTKRRRRRKYGRSSGGGSAELLSPLFVSGDEDCAAVYELLVNTCGLSDLVSETVKPRANGSNGVATVPSDVPLLLSRQVFFVSPFCAMPLVNSFPNGFGWCIPRAMAGRSAHA